MLLAFETKELREICIVAFRAIQKFGPEIAANLRNRLADLRAAVTINDIVVGSPIPIESIPLESLMAIDLGNGASLIIQANHTKNPVRNDGTTDWNKVRRVKIIEINGKKSE